MFGMSSHLRAQTELSFTGKWEGVVVFNSHNINLVTTRNDGLMSCNLIQNGDTISGSCTTILDGKITYRILGVIRGDKIEFKEFARKTKTKLNKYLQPKNGFFILGGCINCANIPKGKKRLGLSGGLSVKNQPMTAHVILQKELYQLDSQSTETKPKELLPTLVLKNLHFALSSHEITGENPDLDRLAAHLLKNPSARIRIEGHTDKEGDAKFNRELSEKRALAVKEYLLKKGAKSEQITTLGFGEEKPLSEIAEENRRVEVYFEK